MFSLSVETLDCLSLFSADFALLHALKEAFSAARPCDGLQVMTLLTAYKDTMRIFLTMCQNVWRSPLFSLSGNSAHLRKHPLPAAASELQSEFGLGTAEEDIGL